MEKLKAVRRVVTGHNDLGAAFFKDDQSFDTQSIPSGDARFALIWATGAIPADNNDETDGRERNAGLTLGKNSGSVIRIVDMLPCGQSPMHRTNSIDFGILLSGQLELELDSGMKTLLGPGDIVVQRGTMHLWRNPSKTETCRIVFILTPANAAIVNGEILPEQHP